MASINNDSNAQKRANGQQLLKMLNNIGKKEVYTWWDTMWWVFGYEKKSKDKMQEIETFLSEKFLYADGYDIDFTQTDDLGNNVLHCMMKAFHHHPVNFWSLDGEMVAHYGDSGFFAWGVYNKILEAVKELDQASTIINATNNDNKSVNDIIDEMDDSNFEVSLGDNWKQSAKNYISGNISGEIENINFNFNIPQPSQQQNRNVVNEVLEGVQLQGGLGASPAV